MPTPTIRINKVVGAVLYERIVHSAVCEDGVETSIEMRRVPLAWRLLMEYSVTPGHAHNY